MLLMSPPRGEVAAGDERLAGAATCMDAEVVWNRGSRNVFRYVPTPSSMDAILIDRLFFMVSYSMDAILNGCLAQWMPYS